MSSNNCEACGESVPADAESCPNCGAAASEGPGISEAADSLRGDQWTTWIWIGGGATIVGGLLVFTIVKQAFVDSGNLEDQGPGYADNSTGAENYLRDTVLPQLEMKFSKEDGPTFTCEHTAEIEAAEESTYHTDVHCESEETSITVAVKIIHGDISMDRDTHIRETTSKQ